MDGRALALLLPMLAASWKAAGSRVRTGLQQAAPEARSYTISWQTTTKASAAAGDIDDMGFVTTGGSYIPIPAGIDYAKWLEENKQRFTRYVENDMEGGTIRAGHNVFRRLQLKRPTSKNKSEAIVRRLAEILLDRRCDSELLYDDIDHEYFTYHPDRRSYIRAFGKKTNIIDLEESLHLGPEWTAGEKNAVLKLVKAEDAASILIDYDFV